MSTKKTKDKSARVDTKAIPTDSRTASSDTDGSAPPRVIDTGIPIDKALAQYVGELSLELAQRRAQFIMGIVYAGKYGEKRPSVTLHPFSMEDDAVMLAFGLKAASLERMACLDVVRQLVDAETLNRIADALGKRGPMLGTVSVTYSPDGKWATAWNRAATAAESSLALAK